MEIDEEEMELEILIAVGVQVMHTSNIWTDTGVINGALGIVEKIVYKPKVSPPKLHTYVLLIFDKYMGVPWDESSPKIVPTPIGRGNRKQILLKLAWGLRIHKSQGLNLEKDTNNIGKQEREGMMFTTIY